MIVSAPKPWEEILGYLDGENNIFLLGCNGCAQASGTGGPAEVAEMWQKLEEVGKKVAGTMVIDFLCQKALVKSRLRPRTEQVAAADSILVMTCGLGVQAVAAPGPQVPAPAASSPRVRPARARRARHRVLGRLRARGSQTARSGRAGHRRVGFRGRAVCRARLSRSGRRDDGNAIWRAIVRYRGGEAYARACERAADSACRNTAGFAAQWRRLFGGARC